MHITCDQWMHRTNLALLFVRSASLKRVDAALTNYSDCASYRYLHDLRQAFDQWKMDEARFEIENMPKIRKAETPEKPARGDYSGFGSSQAIELE